MKLLTRTIRNYIFLSALLLAVCTPLFYFSILELTLQKMDREILSHKAEFFELLPHLKTEEDIKFFRLMNDEFVLEPAKSLITIDSLVTVDVYNEEQETEPHRVLKTGVMIAGKPYQLQIQESMVSTADLVTTIVVIQATLITLLLVGLVFVNQKLSKTIWGPFYTILDRLKKYQIDKDVSIDLPRSSTAEFRDLSSAIAQLVNKNHEAFHSQKEFTENASHELQTPLAIIKGKIDLLMQTPLSEKQAEMIHAMQEATSRMVRLNRNLLLLAQIENQQFMEQESVQILGLTEKLINQFREQLDQKGIKVGIAEAEPFAIQANATVIEILLTNLFTNAIRYSSQNGVLDISICKLSFTITNAGEPLQNETKIFDRFQRGPNSGNGSGIGLAIVKKICELNGYNISYAHRQSKHVFTVKFNKI